MHWGMERIVAVPLTRMARSLELGMHTLPLSSVTVPCALSLFSSAAPDASFDASFLRNGMRTRRESIASRGRWTGVERGGAVVCRDGGS